MPHEIAGVTTCKLPHPKTPGQICGQKFYGPQYLQIGMKDGGRIQQLLEKLTRHLFEDHREYFAGIQVQGEQLKGLLMMQAFQTEDQQLKAQVHYCRWAIHQQTLNARLADDSLHAISLRLAATIAAQAERHLIGQWRGDANEETLRQLIVEIVEPNIRELRDALQEPAEPPNPLAPAVATQ